MNGLKARIKAALSAMPNKDFPSASEGILKALGYWSERAPELSGHVDDFIAAFPAKNKNTQTEATFKEEAKSVRILFQLTDTEIARARHTLAQPADFDADLTLKSFIRQIGDIANVDFLYRWLLTIQPKFLASLPGVLALARNFCASNLNLVRARRPSDKSLVTVIPKLRRGGDITDSYPDT